MGVDVAVAEVQSCPIAVVRRRAAQRDLPVVVPAACGEVWAFIKAHGVQGAGRHVAFYLDDVMNLEIGVEVTDQFAGAGEVIRSATPAGLVATAAHIGPYSGLFQTHQVIHHWCKAQGLVFAGPSWEIYGHMTDPAAPPRTDIFYLLKPSHE